MTDKAKQRDPIQPHEHEPKARAAFRGKDGAERKYAYQYCKVCGQAMKGQR